jgi:NADPH:quinone reductase-like Zn-dependent oxidoreductase
MTGSLEARVVRIHGFGGPEVLRVDTLPIPAPGPGEVRVRVLAIGLNRAEALLRAGLYGEPHPSMPTTIGVEAAGVVESAGDGVEGFRPGDAVNLVPGVASLPFGTYADAIIVPASALVRQPEGLTPVEAAALWVGHLTAYAPLVEIARVGPGDAVLLTAATGSVGLAAIGLVNLLGGRPIAVTRSADKVQLLKDHGAADVIVGEGEELTRQVFHLTDGKGVRVAFDPVAGEQLTHIAKAMALDGIIVHYGNLAGPGTALPPATIFRNLTIAGYAMDLGRNPARRARALEFLTPHFASGALKAVVDATFPLDQAADAHAALEANVHIGKIVLDTGT